MAYFNLTIHIYKLLGLWWGFGHRMEDRDKWTSACDSQFIIAVGAQFVYINHIFTRQLRHAKQQAA